MVNSSKSYFVRPDSVSEVEISPFQTDGNDTTMDSLQLPELEETIEIDDSFAPNIPQDFEPIGQKTVNASSSASRISTLIQANGMFQTIITNFIGKVADEKYDDLSEESLLLD